tara:strand:+ start:17054 stop:17260 length:207 start_codon:yes stop_codon:yes gene_type:complete
MRLQNPPEQYSASYQSSMNLDLEQSDGLNHKKNQDVEVGAARLILRSPNGTRYSVTVDNSGNLSAASI